MRTIAVRLVAVLLCVSCRGENTRSSVVERTPAIAETILPVGGVAKVEILTEPGKARVWQSDFSHAYSFTHEREGKILFRPLNPHDPLFEARWKKRKEIRPGIHDLYITVAYESQKTPHH